MPRWTSIRGNATSPSAPWRRSRGRATSPGAASSRARRRTCTSAPSRLAGPDDAWGEREGRILGTLGEARYWLGEFDLAEAALHRSLALAGDTSDKICAHASRFLADITLTIHGDAPQAEALFARSLEAARRVGDPFGLARTLLMAGWVPFWRNELDRAEAMFREALEVARGNEVGDAWAVSRALVGIANVLSLKADEVEALAVGMEALEVGEAANQAFTAAVAHETVAASLRRLMRLDEALEHAEAAIRTFRELGSRWELASALGDRGAIHRMAGRSEEAADDLREAFVLCRDLRERALGAWTAAELARILAMRGDTAGARQVLADPITSLADGEPGSVTALLMAAAVLALAEDDRETALTKSLAALGCRIGPSRGSERQGGPDLVDRHGLRSRGCGRRRGPRTSAALLEDHHWLQALAEPDLAPDPRADRGADRLLACRDSAQGSEASVRGWLHRHRAEGTLADVGRSNDRVANLPLGPIWVVTAP